MATSLLMLAGAVGATLLWPAETRASDVTPESIHVSIPGEYESPGHCRACHLTEFRAWSGTAHADASFDPVFQVFQQQTQNPAECFSCHTTGYNATSGQFVLAGVTCEACHGPYCEDHSAQDMMIAAPADLCGTCHNGTLAEWVSSSHGKAQVTCTACHEVHSQSTHSAENTNTLCDACHVDQIQDDTHTLHRHIDTGVYCIDCHLARPRDDVGDAVKGQVDTGHAMTVDISTCDDCHAFPLLPGTALP